MEVCQPDQRVSHGRAEAELLQNSEMGSLDILIILFLSQAEETIEKHKFLGELFRAII